MEPSLDELRKNYDRLSDSKLLGLATEEATSLRPEALDLLQQIIKERGLLKENVTAAVNAQFEAPDENTITSYCKILRHLPCPVCGSTSQPLNASVIKSVTSFIILTQHKNEFRIACPDCLDKANTKATIHSALFGWWGLPWGIVRTFQALLGNDKMRKQHRLSEPNDLFKVFTAQRVGRIELNKNNSQELQSLIKTIR